MTAHRPRRPAARGARGRRITGTLHRLEPLAPQWLVTVVKPKPAPTPWAAMIRYAISIGGALLAGVLTGQTALGGLLATGALTGAFGDQGGPLPHRLRRIAAGLGGAAVGLVLSRLLLDEAGPGTVLLVAVAGVASAYLSALSAVASFAGLQLLVNTAVGAGLGPQLPLPVLLGGFLAGALWSTLLSVLFAVVRPEAGGPRVAVATMLDRLSEYVEAVRAGSALRTPRAALARAMADAYDAVTAARATSPGRREDLHRLAAVMEPAAELARAAAADPQGVEGLTDRLRPLRQRVAGDRRARLGFGPLRDDRATAALERLERVVGSPRPVAGTRSRRRGPSVPERLAGRRNAVFAVRIALCLAVAEGLRLVLPLSHPYWLLLTVAVVLKPDLGSVFARGLQRTGGTLVGALVGIAVLAVVPAGPLLLIPVLLIAFLFPLAAKRNYGMLATFITPLVLILVDIAGAPVRGLATSRLIDTVLGAAIVLLVGYLPWPTTWRPRLGRGVADALEAVTAYAAVAVDGPRAPAGPARRRAFAALQNARADLQSALAEPAARSRYAAAWWPVIGQIEQIADDLRAAHLVAGAAGDLHAGTGQVVGALQEVTAAMRSRRRPQGLPLPHDGPLGAVGQDIAGLRRMLEGPVEPPRRAAGHRRGAAGATG